MKCKSARAKRKPIVVGNASKHRRELTRRLELELKVLEAESELNAARRKKLKAEISLWKMGEPFFGIVRDIKDGKPISEAKK